MGREETTSSRVTWDDRNSRFGIELAKSVANAERQEPRILRGSYEAQEQLGQVRATEAFVANGAKTGASPEDTPLRTSYKTAHTEEPLTNSRRRPFSTSACATKVSQALRCGARVAASVELQLSPFQSLRCPPQTGTLRLSRKLHACPKYLAETASQRGQRDTEARFSCAPHRSFLLVERRRQGHVTCGRVGAPRTRDATQSDSG